MKIDKKDFLTAVKKVSMAAEQKATLPILSNICIKTENGNTYLTATDLEVEIEYKYPFQIIEEETAFLIEAKKLLKALNSLPKPETDVSLKDNKLLIKSGRLKSFLLISNNTEDFPTFEAQETPLFEIKNAKIFRSCLSKTLHAASKEESRYALQGVNLKNEGNTLKIAATDGHRLAYDETDIEGSQNNIWETIPLKAVNILLKLITGYEELIQVFTSKEEEATFLTFETQEWKLKTRLLNGSFPQYEGLLEDNAEHKITVSVNPLLNAVKRVINISENPVVILSFEEEKITVESKSEQAKTVEELEEKTGINMRIGINGKYLTECLSQFNGAQVNISLTSPTEKILFTPLEEDNKYKEIIMPVEI